MDPLEIVLKVVDEQAVLRLRQFGEGAKKVVKDIQAAQQEASDRQQAIDRERDYNLRQSAAAALADRKKKLKEATDAARAGLKDLADFEKRMADEGRKLAEGRRESDRKVIQATKADRDRSAREALQLAKKLAADIARTEKEAAANTAAIQESQRKVAQSIAADRARTDKDAAARRQRAAREAIELTKKLQAEIAQTEKEAAADAAAMREKAAQDAVESSRRSAKEQEGIQEKLNQDRRRAIREQARNEKGSAAERLKVFDAEVEGKRKKLREMVADGRASGEDLIRFERDAAAERNILAKENSNAILNVAQAYTGMRIAALGMQAVRFVWDAITESIKSANDHMKQMSDQMERAREHSVELARLLGVKPTGEFSAAQAQEAASLGLRREQWQQFQTSFYNEVGGSVMPADDRRNLTPQQMFQEGYRVTSGEASKFQRMTAAYAVNVEGLTEAQAASAAASVVQTAPAGATAEQMMDQFAKMTRMAVRSRGGTSQMIEAMGVTAAEYAQNADEKGDWGRAMEYGALASVEAERNPQNVVTAVRAFDRWQRQMRLSRDKEKRKQGWSRMDELGITPGMGPRAAVGQLDAKLKAWKAAGKDEREFWDRYGGGFQFSFTAVQAAGRRANVMDRVLAEAGGRTGAQAQAETGAALADVHQPGMQRAEEARIEAAQLRQAARDDYLRSYERRAIASLERRGELRAPEGGWEAAQTKGGEAWGQGSREEQLIRREMNAMLNSELSYRAFRENNPAARRFFSDRGITEPLIKLPGWQEGAELFGMYTPKSEMSEGAQVLGKILEENQKTNKLLEEQAKQRAGAPAAAPAVPPPIRGARVPQAGARNP